MLSSLGSDVATREASDFFHHRVGVGVHFVNGETNSRMRYGERGLFAQDTPKQGRTRPREVVG